MDVIVPSTGEFPTVYERAHHYGLIEKKSQLYDTISRVEFAKMMTLFIENVR
ncbi:hypothetical protein KBC03_06200 [Patescibacteria group bacterium]|nr:hypothetical protein [Patescibacteria group bacterium]